MNFSFNPNQFLSSRSPARAASGGGGETVELRRYEVSSEPRHFSTLQSSTAFV